MTTIEKPNEINVLKLKSHGFRVRSISAVRAVIERILGGKVEENLEVTFPGGGRQSCVEFEGALHGRIYVSMDAGLITALGRSLLGSCAEQDFENVHVLWEIANIIAGALSVAMEEFGIDVQLSAVRPLGRLQAQEMEGSAQCFAVRHDMGMLQVAVLLLP